MGVLKLLEQLVQEVHSHWAQDEFKKLELQSEISSAFPSSNQ